MPDATTLFRDYALPGDPGNAEWLYRILSGYAHAKTWPSLFSDLRGKVAIPGVPDQWAVAAGADEKWAYIFAQSLMEALQAALEDAERYSGVT